MQTYGEAQVHTIIDTTAHIEVVLADIALLVLTEEVSRTIIVVHGLLTILSCLLEQSLVVGIDTVPAPLAHFVVLDGRKLALRGVAECSASRQNLVEVATLVIVETESKARLAHKPDGVDYAYLVKAGIGLVAIDTDADVAIAQVIAHA